MTSLVPRPLGPNTQTSQPHPGYTAPILAMTGEATSTRFLSTRSSGSTTENISSPSPATTNVISDRHQWLEKQQSIAFGGQSFYRGSHDMHHPSMGLHINQFESRQTSQPWIGPTVPVLATAGETTSTHFLSLCGSGSTTERLPSPEAFSGRIVVGSIMHNETLFPNPVENAWGSPVNVSSIPTTTNVQPVQPSSDTSTLKVIELEDVEVTCLLCGGAFFGYQASSHLRGNHPTLVRKNDRSLCPLCTTTPAKEITNFCRHFQKHHKVLRFKCLRCSYTALERWNVARHVQKMRGKSRCVKD
ncbi:hypothetical protein EDD85DRAFT_838265 [Armillaria nabsnona]|nr:hypothetical protein EDD85DRAFT_838265 [Armillaria nabsnona]